MTVVESIELPQRTATFSLLDFYNNGLTVMIKHMSEPMLSRERRLIENEMVFRSFNEDVQEGIDSLKKIAKEDGQEHLIEDIDTPMHFYCECSDENCHERVVIKPSDYDRIHKNRKRFIIKPKHEVSTIEKIVVKKPSYYVVEKFNTIPEKHMSLNTTDVNNS